ncbi:MAG: flagellar hook-basal body complex protein FliE [Planctomycetes bacterium]|nr:flagellar hook-basal body complex protein FliE [Planctomycetota bacterium]
MSPAPINPAARQALDRMAWAQASGASSGASPAEGFGSHLVEALERTDSLQKVADNLVDRVGAGDPEVDVHDVMLALSEAELSFRLMLEIRNRAVEAYQELSRLQV